MPAWLLSEVMSTLRVYTVMLLVGQEHILYHRIFGTSSQTCWGAFVIFFSLNWFISGKEACQTFIKGVFSTPVPPFLGKVKHVFQLG